MCNLAGYVGSRRAAPILLEMSERQEGFAGGFYSGIATVDDGKLHVAKVIGDVHELSRTTDAADLPGRIGIVHSRSRGGGGQTWAQPFVDGTEQLAYMANGDVGAFRGSWPADAIAADLLAAGCEFSSRLPESVGPYQAELPDGFYVHGSEVMCHLIASMLSDSSPSEALCKGFSVFPSEIAGMMVHAKSPDHLFAARINKALMVGHAENCAYVATTAMSFPSGECDRVDTVAPNSTVYVSIGRTEVNSINPSPGPVGETVAPNAADEAVLATLAAEKGRHFGAIKRGIAHMWPDGPLAQDDITVYSSLERLTASDLVCSREIKVPGVLEGSHAPKKVFFLGMSTQA